MLGWLDQRPATLTHSSHQTRACWTGDSSQESAELYDPASGTFTPTGNMSVTRSCHSATLLADGRVLIVGGHRFNFRNSALASAEIYDHATGIFAPTAGMSIGRQDHTATLLPDGRVLVVGGYDDEQDNPTAQDTGVPGESLAGAEL